MSEESILGRALEFIDSNNFKKATKKIIGFDILKMSLHSKYKVLHLQSNLQYIQRKKNPYFLH